MAGIDFSALTKPLNVDNHLPVRMYLRSARNVLKAAEVYRLEGNKVQLYIFLMRFVNLVFETIPKHKDAGNPMYTGERQFLRKKGLEAVAEMEELKPHVDLMKKLGALHLDEPFPEEEDGVVPSYFPTSPHKSQALASVGMAGYFGPLYPQNGTPAPSDLDEWARSIGAPATAQQQSYGMMVSTPAPPLISSSFPASLPLAVSSLSLSSSLPRPTSEALSRHSFFSFSSSSQAQQASAPAGPIQISYPALDATPITMPDLLSLQQPQQPPAPTAASTSEPQSQPAAATSTQSQSQEATPSTPAPSTTDSGDKEMISVLLPTPQGDTSKPPLEAAAAAAASAASPAPRVQPMPPPVLAQVHTVPKDVPLPQPPHSHSCNLSPVKLRQPPPGKVADPRPGKGVTQVGAGTITKSGGVKAVHISPKMMQEFMRIVQNNTKRNLETCGILAGNLKKGIYSITTLILPKQEATSDSCSTLNEEEIFEVQDKKSLFQVGWIHTHPSQACFMSSIDLHTHYSYQVMLPEAIAIVMAPSDSSRQSGIFRLSDPGGMKVISGCRQRGFHPHEAPADGSPIYVHSSHVFYNPKINFEVIDIRAT